MKIIFIIALLLFSVSCSSSKVTYEDQRLFNKVLLAKKSHDINKLSDEDYDTIVLNLSRGERRWIEIYPDLKKAPFDGVTHLQEGLNIAMASALPENPSAVIRFVNETNVKFICGIPFIESTPAEVEAYYVKASAAIEDLTSGGPWKKRCLLTLKKAVAAEPLAQK